MRKGNLTIIVTIICALALACGLIGCSSSDSSTKEEEPKNVLENSNIKIEGVYVDESYAGSNASSDIKRMYIFAEVTPTSGTLEVSSASFSLEASRDDATDTLSSLDVITKDTDSGQMLATYATSYTCTNIITKITPGSSVKIIIPFNVPAYYLQEGGSFSLSDTKDISNDLKFDSEYVQDEDSLQAIAEAADPDGYAAAMIAREDASPEVAQDVMNRLSGYEYSYSYGGLTQRFTFDGDQFVAKAAGLENPGTYTVKNGYLACKQSSTGWVTWIPWEWDDTKTTGIDIEIGDLFVVK